MSPSPQKDGGAAGEGAQSPSDTPTSQQNNKTQNPEEGDQEEKQTNQDPEGEMQGHPATQEQALQYETEVKEQDRWLPIANDGHPQSTMTPAPPSSPRLHKKSKKSTNDLSGKALIGNFAPVARIMKTALPENAKIAKDAKECMQECVSEFISFITSEAAEKCQLEKRKTVNGEDILFAMQSLGFENYGEALKIYLARYRETNLSKSEAQQQGRPAGGYAASGNAEEQPAGADEEIPEATDAPIVPPPDASGAVSAAVGTAPAFVGTQEMYPGHNGPSMWLTIWLFSPYSTLCSQMSSKGSKQSWLKSSQVNDVFKDYFMREILWIYFLLESTIGTPPSAISQGK
ncbi:MAG: hypothetical protein M1828_005383 [Chrysothrix sp. TS-e1954]|nr:MAG: hypothetical protein M1828_005383 [Chrysothrix sp. TS-e1954]